MKRFIYQREKTKRGCCYCADAIIGIVRIGTCKKTELYRETAKYCPYKECPYHELDKCKSFAAYLKDVEKKFGTVAKLLGIKRGRKIKIKKKKI